MSNTQNSAFETPNWAALAESIRDGEAILLLGPDALPMYRKENTEGGRCTAQRIDFQPVIALKN